MAWVLGYGCTSAAGANKASLWQALLTGPISYPVPPVDAQCSSGNAGLWPDRASATSNRDLLVRELIRAYRDAIADISEDVRERLALSKRVGVIFSSTKGFIDDLVWQAPTTQLEQQLQSDTLTGVLKDFLRQAEISPIRQVVVSNACASALSAFFLARRWLALDLVDDVIVLAADVAGPFVQKGFQCLKVLSADATRPFARTRSGFSLGEAAAVILLSKQRAQNSDLYLAGVGVDAEGFAVTRPSQSGESLKRAILQIKATAPPDLILAHGTATSINDATEDHVYHELFSADGETPPITASKWLVGHTLGACGAIDFIAGCESLRSQRTFKIATTSEIDPVLKSNYLHAQTDAAGDFTFDRVLLSSLGFGGIHAAALLERRSATK